MGPKWNVETEKLHEESLKQCTQCINTRGLEPQSLDWRAVGFQASEGCSTTDKIYVVMGKLFTPWISTPFKARNGNTIFEEGGKLKKIEKRGIWAYKVYGCNPTDLTHNETFMLAAMGRKWTPGTHKTYLSSVFSRNTRGRASREEHASCAPLYCS